jgi:hypothetical protein
MHHVFKKFVRLSLVAGSAFLGTACSGVDGSEVETVGAAEAAISASGWGLWQATTTNANGFEGSPGASLNAPNGGVLIGRDKITNRFRVSAFRQGPFAAWSDFGTKTFIAKPAVAALDGFYGTPQFLWSNQLAVVGVASDSQYYIRIGQLDTTEGFTSNPTLVPGHDWTVIPNSTYASPPAATVYSGTLVVAGRKSNNTLFLHSSVLAITMQANFFTNVWSAPVAVPALPSGWVAQGDPALAAMGDTNSRIMIVTRAVNNGQKRLYANTWDRTTFFGWVSIPLTGVNLSGEPAAEYAPTLNKVTVYVKGADSKIYQSSGLNSSWEAFTAIGSNTFASNPAAVGGGSGNHHMAFAGLPSSQFLISFSAAGGE